MWERGLAIRPLQDLAPVEYQDVEHRDVVIPVMLQFIQAHELPLPDKRP